MSKLDDEDALLLAGENLFELHDAKLPRETYDELMRAHADLYVCIYQALDFSSRLSWLPNWLSTLLGFTPAMLVAMLIVIPAALLSVTPALLGKLFYNDWLVGNTPSAKLLSHLEPKSPEALQLSYRQRWLKWLVMGVVLGVLVSTLLAVFPVSFAVLSAGLSASMLAWLMGVAVSLAMPGLLCVLDVLRDQGSVQGESWWRSYPCRLLLGALLLSPLSVLLVAAAPAVGSFAVWPWLVAHLPAGVQGAGLLAKLGMLTVAWAGLACVLQFLQGLMMRLGVIVAVRFPGLGRALRFVSCVASLLLVFLPGLWYALGAGLAVAIPKAIASLQTLIQSGLGASAWWLRAFTGLAMAFAGLSIATAVALAWCVLMFPLPSPEPSACMSWNDLGNGDKDSYDANEQQRPHDDLCLNYLAAKSPEDEKAHLHLDDLAFITRLTNEAMDMRIKQHLLTACGVDVSGITENALVAMRPRVQAASKLGSTGQIYGYLVNGNPPLKRDRFKHAISAFFKRKPAIGSDSHAVQKAIDGAIEDAWRDWTSGALKLPTVDPGQVAERDTLWLAMDGGLAPKTLCVEGEHLADDMRYASGDLFPKVSGGASSKDKGAGATGKAISKGQSPGHQL